MKFVNKGCVCIYSVLARYSFLLSSEVKFSSMEVKVLDSMEV
jgi:hypothetical protein